MCDGGIPGSICGDDDGIIHIWHFIDFVLFGWVARVIVGA